MPSKHQIVVDRAVVEISCSLIRMMRDLPVDFASQKAIHLLIGQLTKAHPWLIGLIMEDKDVREAYAVAVAEMPATARPW